MSEKSPIVSIILPIYNAEARIGKCLETLLNQTLHNIEIIAVLDCPTDKTADIVRKYAAKDERIVVVENEKNLHIGECRNVGLRYAKGKYIGFSDDDDFRKLNMYESLVKIAEQEDADIVFTPSLHISEDRKEKMNEFDFTPQKNIRKYSLSDLIGNGNNERYESLFINIHGCIYRYSLIYGNHITFVDTRKITPEDRIFQIETFCCAKKISVLRRFFYYHITYGKNEGMKSTYKDMYHRCAGLEYLYNYLKEKDIFQTYKENFYICVQKQFIDCLARTLYPLPNIKQFVTHKNYLRSFVFCSDAFAVERFIHEKKGIKRLFRKMLISTLR